MNDRPTFSPFWHRVRTMKPRLRPHVQITRQQYRGRRWHVVHDPASNQFYRLNPIAHDLVGMLDGTRDVETAWKASLAKFGDHAPTQNEVIQLLSQLYSSNLLSVDTTPETEQLLRRGRDRLKQKIAAQAIGIMYFKLRVFNPDRMLRAIEPILRPVLNKWGLLAWFAFLVFALANVLPQWDVLEAEFSHAISPHNWPWMLAAFVLTKAVHETGHGVICRRFGGQVPEMGFMLLVLLPSPYVDASSCWAFPSKWQRMAVGAGGMIFELFIASVAALYWIGAEEGLPRQLAFNAMFSASISTVLFNANPLMRFDGYYILSDLLEIPNLSQRSTKMLWHLVQKYIYRLRNLTAPSQLPGEQAILIAYGMAAGAYRIFLFITITLYVMGQLFAVGLVLAIWTAAAWFIIPVGKFIHWLAASPALGDRRGRTILTSMALIAAGVIGIGVIPMPDRRRGVGVVESVARSGVFAETDGFVEECFKKPGESVVKGEPILRLVDPDLMHRREGVSAQLAEFQVQERAANSAREPGAAVIAQNRIAVALENLEELERRVESLIVRAPHDGVIVSDDPERRMGSFIRRGESVCEVVDTSHLRIAAVMDQRQAAWLFSGRGRGADGLERAEPGDVAVRAFDVQVKPRSQAYRELDGVNVRVIDAGQKLLPHPSLGAAGGGRIETDAKDQSGRISKRPRFAVQLEPAEPAKFTNEFYPGERVVVRFSLERKPLLFQWIDRLEKEIQGRVKL